MAIRYLPTQAVLDGVVTVEDAEQLLQWLRGRGDAAVCLAACDHVHAAVLQVLLATRPRLDGVPADPWLAATLGLQVEPTP